MSSTTIKIHLEICIRVYIPPGFPRTQKISRKNWITGHFSLDRGGPYQPGFINGIGSMGKSSIINGNSMDIHMVNIC